MGMSPKYLRPRASGAFKPTQIAGLDLWLDASVSSSMTLNGSNVSEWRDLSGNSRHATQTTAATQPAFTQNAQNGLSALTFSGSQTMSVAAFPVAKYASGAAVVQFSGSGQAVLQRGSVNDVHALFNESNLIRLRNNGAVQDCTATSVINTSYVIVFSLFTELAINGSQTSDMRVNGIAATQASYTHTSGSLPDKSLTIGGLSSSVYLLNGILCELVYYQGTSAVSAVSLAALEKYLARKWGISL